MQLIQVTHEVVRSLLEQFNTPYGVIQFDEAFYQDCVDEATRRGYPVDGVHSVRTLLREGVMYATTAGMHLLDRLTRIWIALYTSCFVYTDDIPERFPEELPNLYLFNDRLIRKEPHGNGVLDAFADIVRRSKDLYQPIASQLIITSTQNFVAATLLEHETTTMKISGAAHQYPPCQRTLSGNGVAYALFAFPREIPLNDYIQAIPEIVSYLQDLNDIMSFYKEELAGETTNQISLLAARTQKSKLEVLGELAKSTIEIYKRILEILGEYPEARKAFELYATGYIYYHTSIARYRLEDLKM